MFLIWTCRKNYQSIVSSLGNAVIPTLMVVVLAQHQTIDVANTEVNVVDHATNTKIPWCLFTE